MPPGLEQELPKGDGYVMVVPASELRGSHRSRYRPPGRPGSMASLDSMERSSGVTS